MLARLRARLTYANVMATLAVFVALGGSGYAAIEINGKDIKDRTISKRKIKKKTLTATEVKDQSLLAKNFKLGQLPRGQRGPGGSPAASMLTGSTQNGALPAIGQTSSLFVPPSGVATFGGSGLQLSPYATVLARDLAVALDNAPPGSAVLRFTFNVNDAQTALSCTVQPGTKTCHDAVHVVTVPPAAVITFIVDNPGSGNSAGTGARWAWRATTP